MRLFLIRHGETVDNVAGVYAGSRDSALTAHGVLQARRLASHLAEHFVVRHMFSSNLRRAVKTAEAVRDELERLHGVVVPIVQRPELREKDFGTGEGAKFRTSTTGPRHEHEGAETSAAMRERVNRFLDSHLMAVLENEADTSNACVIVAHGLILGTLFRALYARFPANAATLSREAQSAGINADASSPVTAAWSNTGYLEATVSPVSASPPNVAVVHVDAGPASRRRLQMRIVAVNRVDHLKGLRKTRGGIGSAQFDDKQKSLDSFFTAGKKRKAEDAVAN